MKIIPGASRAFVPASHEDPSAPGVYKKILGAGVDFLQGRVRMINWALLPCGSSFRPHYHEDMQEVFVIMRGRVEINVDGQTAEMQSGDAVFIEPREVHVMRNCGDSDAEYLVVGISLDQGGKSVLV